MRLEPLALAGYALHGDRKMLSGGRARTRVSSANVIKEAW